jgi:hypothetical protein
MPVVAVSNVKPVQANRPPQGQPAPGDQPLIPPDEKFWQRYSANAEMPLSSLASVVFHMVLFGVLMIGVLDLFRSSDPPIDLEPIEYGDGIEGGGGGSTIGLGTGPQLSKPEDVAQDLKPQTKAELLKPDVDPNIKADTSPKLADDPDAERMSIIEDIKKKKPAAGMFIKDALEGLTGAGKGGSGYGGGEGTGIGTGRGSGVGPGTGPLNRRGKRLLRWSMNFKANSGEEYVRQLNAIGAIIGIPDRTGKLMIIRNLTERPAQPKYESVRDLNRIWWTDEREGSCREVAEALKLDILPSQIWAFFPQEIEQQLVKVELDYGRKYGRKTEDDIKETEFNLTFRAGKPVFTVKRQEGK